MPCREVAAFLGLAVSTVHDTEQRALKRLRSFYDRAGLLPEER
jgi:DNA-directed RNA polymerase specialized sigma24 family protein